MNDNSLKDKDASKLLRKHFPHIFFENYIDKLPSRKL